MAKFSALRRMLQPAQGVIFDFDGLLADSERYHYLSYRAVFNRYGHDLDETEYYKYWTSLGQGTIGEIQRHGLKLDPLDVREEKRPIFSRFCEDGSIRLYDEAVEMLDMFAKSGKKLAIASGSSRRDIMAVLKNAGKLHLIGTILGSDVVPVMKPAPDIFLKTVAAMGLSPVECVVFEDAEKGVTAARNAGIPVIVVRTPETAGFDFDSADLVLDSHAELIGFLKRIL